MSDEDDKFQLFNQSDFESIIVEGTVLNTTSKSPIVEKPGGRLMGSRPDHLKDFVLEVEDQGMVLSLPKASSAAGHQFTIDMTARKGKDGTPVHFSTTAKVIDVKREDGADFTVIRLVQFDQSSWDQFLWLFRERQEEILDYFMRVKDVG